MSTKLASLHYKWSINREGGVQNFEKLVYVDCERPLISSCFYNNWMGASLKVLLGHKKSFPVNKYLE